MPSSEEKSATSKFPPGTFVGDKTGTVAFPCLYKKTSTGAIQFWKINVVEANLFPAIETIYGQLGTISPQTTCDVIKEGKNQGKKNETTAQQQAENEALARWQKQIKKGYVEDVDKANAGEDDIGGVKPMLAHRFDDHGHKIKYPCFVQPKLDGTRCIAIIEDGKATLWSRTRKPIHSAPHIVAELERLIPTPGRTVLDGELYNHNLKRDFEELISAIRKQEGHAKSHLIEYHVYDIVSDAPYEARMKLLDKNLPNIVNGNGCIVRVQTATVTDPNTIKQLHDLYVADGYEGAIVRHPEGGYESDRSYRLQKVKIMRDDEFPIIGVSEGRGKLVGCAIFKCVAPNGETFDVNMKGPMEKRKELYENPSLWQGKQLTVQYFRFTKRGVPYLPVGLRIREEE